MNDNAYKIELPGGYGVHATFNVGDLSPYLDDDGISELRSIPFKEGGDDAVSDAQEVLLVVGKEVLEGPMARGVCLVTWEAHLARVGTSTGDAPHPETQCDALRTFVG